MFVNKKLLEETEDIGAILIFHAKSIECELLLSVLATEIRDFLREICIAES